MDVLDSPRSGARDRIFRGLNRRDSLVGASIALGCALVYLALRPPLYDFDGYLYRLYAIVPDPWTNVNPHHLLWNDVQRLLGSVATLIGHPSTVPFQVFNIIISALTLLCFYVLLHSYCSSKWLCISALLFLAFSPAYWFLTLENHPYPSAFLCVLVFFLVWRTGDDRAPAGSRLAVATASLIVASLFYQAAALLVIPGMIVIFRYNSGSRFSRGASAIAWSMVVLSTLMVIYLCFWLSSGTSDSFLRWTTSYAYELHPVQALQMRIATLFARGMVGFSGSLIQSDLLRQAMSDKAPRRVLLFYGAFGLTLAILMFAYLLQAGTRERLSGLFRTSPIFALAAFSALVSWGLACAWEGITDHYWMLGNICAIVCVAMLMRSSVARSIRLLISSLLILTAWNLYGNIQQDLVASTDFPDPLLITIKQHVRKGDLFLVLGQGVYGGVNYELLLEILRASAEQPADDPALAILNDLAGSQGPKRAWRDVLEDKIDSTLKAGGRVYVAKHLFNPDEYADLSGEQDPFAPQVNTQFSSINGQDLYKQLQELFSDYVLYNSDFTVGTDKYFLLKRKQPEAQNSPTDDCRC